MFSRRRAGLAEVGKAGVLEPRVPGRQNLDSSNALELVGFTVDPGGSAVLCLTPQLYSGFPLSADSKAHQFGSTVGPVIS